MILTKNDLEQIARGRYFKLRIKRQLWLVGLSVVWALCWVIPTRDADMNGNYIFMIIGMIPMVIEAVYLFVLAAKEDKYVVSFMAENGNLIGKEL